jgi:hypothetical protein
MAANSIAIVPGKIAPLPGVAFALADGTTTKAIVTADATNGTRIDGLVGCSDDTVDRIFSVFWFDGTADKRIGEAKITAGAGTSGTPDNKPAISLLNRGYWPWIDNSGSLFIPAGYSLRFACQTTVTTGKTVTITPMGGHF